MTDREREVLQLIEADPMISQQELADRLGIARSSVAVHITNLTRKGLIIGKGYVLRSSSYAVVVGGVNMDIGGISDSPLRAEDSNPGMVRTAPGGVGRNIAHNACLLGTDVRLLTAVGDDENGRLLSASCTSLGIDMTHALTVPGGRTSTYLYIAAPNGDMALALNDMAICEKLTPEYLASRLSLLNNASVVVADANLPQESLAYLAEHCTPSLFVDTVSMAKAGKIVPILSRIHTLKPNRREAEFLTGIAIEGREDAGRAAQALLRTGVKRVFLSMGADGVCAAEGDTLLWLENLPGSCVNTTGCGDAFMGALVWAALEELDLKQSALAGLAAASIAMESNETVNPGLNAQLLRSRIQLHA